MSWTEVKPVHISEPKYHILGAPFCTSSEFHVPHVPTVHAPTSESCDPITERGYDGKRSAIVYPVSGKQCSGEFPLNFYIICMYSKW